MSCWYEYLRRKWGEGFASCLRRERQVRKKNTIIFVHLPSTLFSKFSTTCIRSVFFWRAGGDGRYQSQIFLPPSPLDSQKHRSKLGAGSFNWTTVCWAEPKLLLMSSSFGELISWDLTKVSGKNKPVYKPIHACHNRGLFSIATYIQIEDKNEQTNWREKIAFVFLITFIIVLILFIWIVLALTIYFSIFRRRIWTLGQDRQVICCDLLEDKATIEYRIPTQGGFVYCLSACPLDTTQIAFGAGDAMLRIWNLSEPHESSFEIATLWQKIMGKVRAVSVYFHYVNQKFLELIILNSTIYL